MNQNLSLESKLKYDKIERKVQHSSQLDDQKVSIPEEDELTIDHGDIASDTSYIISNDLDFDNGNSIDFDIDMRDNVNWKIADSNLNYPSREEAEKRKELSEKQIKKVRQLREKMFDAIAEEILKRDEKKQWRDDLERVNDYLEKISPSTNFEGYFKRNILSPSEMEKLNEIYDRWT